MSQQQQPPRQGMGQQSQQGMGQQGQQQLHTGQQQLVPQKGQELDEDLTSELRVALHDFEEVSRTTRWCVDKMIDEGPQMVECIRCCQDLADLADLNVNMITRDSIYGLEAAMLYAAVAEDALQTIEQYRMPHCQETADAVRRSLDSCWQLVETFGQPQLMQQVQQQLRQTHQQAQQQTPQEIPPSVEQAQGMSPSQAEMGGQGQQMGAQGQQMGGQMQQGGQMGSQGRQTGGQMRGESQMTGGSGQMQQGGGQMGGHQPQQF